MKYLLGCLLLVGCSNHHKSKPLVKCGVMDGFIEVNSAFTSSYGTYITTDNGTKVEYSLSVQCIIVR